MSLSDLTCGFPFVESYLGKALGKLLSMRVLLTGGSGFIGQHLAGALNAEGIDVYTLGRTSPRAESNYHNIDLLAKQDFYGLMEAANPTHLIHLAWCTEHGKYWGSQDNLIWMASTRRLFEAFAKHGGTHAFVAGTCAEYDWRYGYCDEELTPCNPGTLYGIAKDATRRMCQLLASSYDVPLTWGRIFFPYGPGENSRRLIPSLFSAFRGELEPFGVNKHYLRDFVHVDDLVSAILICIRKKLDGVINLSSGNPVALEQIVRIIATVEGKDPSLILDKKAPNRAEPPLLVGKNEKLRSLGWIPGQDLENALATW
jgi:nucleoside-diphosphate-sugar epimerase